MVRSSLTLKNDLAELTRMNVWLEELAEGLNLEPKAVYALDLALEEIVTNVMKYAYGPGVEADIELLAKTEGRELILEVMDSGREFNPLEIEDPEQGLAVEEMDIGGLGIHLTKQFVERVEYRRENGKNILLIGKNLETGTA